MPSPDEWYEKNRKILDDEQDRSKRPEFVSKSVKRRIALSDGPHKHEGVDECIWCGARL
jgi:hypothetical protein